MRGAIYLRMSDDRTGLEAGVGRQRDDCLAYCAANGIEVVQVFQDNDISAYSGKRRPAYEAMLEQVRAGTLDCIVAWHIDRLYRRPAELEALIDLAERLSVHTPFGDINLATGDGRFLARILVSVAAKSSDDASRRIRRQKAELKAQGLYIGGPRPFGWEPGLKAVREDEAVLIREAAAAILAGASVRSVAAQWDRWGVKTPQNGKAWSLSVMRSVLTAERNVGPILAPETHSRLVASFAGRRRGFERGFGLLTGVLRCARCGTGMTRAVNGSPPRASYRCPGCYLSIRLSMLEAHVADEVRKAMVRLPAEVDDSEVETVLADEAKLERLAFDYADGLITREQMVSATARIKDRIARTRRPLRPTVTGEWDTMTPQAKRAMIAALAEYIEVGPAIPGRAPRFDPDRVHIEWR